MEPLPSDERARIAEALAQVRTARAAEAPPLPSIPGYELERELHRGGQGVVFLARQRSTGQPVALKLLREEHAGTSARARFEREVAVLAALEHPALVRIHDCGVHAGRFFYAMEFVAGRDLDEELRVTPRDLRARVELLARVAHAVAAAHQRGVLHRDLKPGNIRIDTRGAPRLLDFGLARWLREGTDEAHALTESGGFVGSAPWASPEQVAGRSIDARSDVYSLGVVAYQALTGRFPYPVDGPLADVFESIRTRAPLDARRASGELDRDLATILARALEKDPERRYASALDFARDLEHWHADRPIEARRASPAYVAWKAVRRRPGTALGALVALLALFGVLAFLAQQRSELSATVARLEARVHAEELRRLGDELERGDGLRLGAALAAVPAARRDWLVEHFEGEQRARELVFAAEGERPLALAFAPGGDALALGTWQGVVRGLSRADGRELWRNDTELGEVRSLEFTRDGALVAALESRGIALLGAGDGALVRRLAWNEGGLERLSLDDEHAHAASAAGTLVRFALAAEGPPRVLRLSHGPSGAADDGGRASGIDLTAVSAAAGRAATVGDGELVLWDLDGALVARVPLVSFESLAVRGLAFSADGDALVLAFPALDTRPASLWVLDAADGARRRTLENLATTPDPLVLVGADCLIGAPNGALRLVELASGRTRRVLPGRGRALDLVRVSPDGRELYVLARALERVRLEPPALRRPSMPEPVSATLAESLRFPAARVLARDGARLALAGENELRVHADGRAEALFGLHLPEPETITALCFLVGEELLAAGTERGRVWFVGPEGDLLAVLPGLEAALTALEFEPATRTLTGRDREGRELAWRAHRP